VNAFKFIGKGGKVTTLRYRIVPVAAPAYLEAEALAAKSPTYLFNELGERLQSQPIEFKLVAQIAGEGDVTDDATVVWPEGREVVELGTLRVEKTLREEESRALQKKIIFDPIPRVEGVEASDDPLLEVRANVYLISGRQRRAAMDAGAVEGAAKEDVKAAT
jgi:catalase